jgi:hypothetical protein
MPLACQDFVPAVTQSGFFSSEFEALPVVLARANEWMRHTGVRVINVETVVLPNLGTERASELNGVRISGESSSHWFQVIRVWYETEAEPTAPPPLPG